MTAPTPGEQQDMLDLRTKAQAWIDSLLVAGMSEAAAVAAIHLSLVERALVSGGVAKTATWLRAQAKQVEVNGPALLKELKAQGH
jgi:hypothetical protein